MPERDLPHTRLFVALDLPDAARAEIAWTAEGLDDPPGIRRVASADLHITLRFVGALDPAAMPAFCAELFRALQGPAHQIRLGRAVARPRRGAARIVVRDVVDLSGGMAAQAARIDAVVDRFATGPRPRPFRPHVTVVRFRRPTGVRRYPHRQNEHVFDIDRVSLYHSDQVEGGPPHYRSLMTVPLAQGRERNASDG